MNVTSTNTVAGPSVDSPAPPPAKKARNDDWQRDDRTKINNEQLQPDHSDVTNLTMNMKDRPEWKADWPALTGPIDTMVHDLPHKSSDVEWWYINTHLTSESGKEISLFASFFRRVVGFNKKTQEFVSANAVTWAITDVSANKYYSYSMLDPVAPEYVHKNIANEANLDDHLRRSLLEMVEKGKLPLPDMMIEGEMKIGKSKLELDFGGNTFMKDADGHYHIHLEGKRATDGKECSCTLKLEPKKPFIRNRSDGCVKVGLHGDDMFYYFCPRNDCSGSVTIEGEEFKCAGNAWYDREFGGTIRTTVQSDLVGTSSRREESVENLGWKWLSLQIDDGSELTACVIEDPMKPKAERVVDAYVISFSANGTRAETSCVVFDAVEGRTWRSTQTFVEYPTEWTLKSDDIDLHLTTDGINAQEFVTLIAKPAFWEGRIKAYGTIGKKKVTGLGFVEWHGYGRENMKNLKCLFNEAGKEMRHHMSNVMPINPDNESLKSLIGVDGFKAVQSFPLGKGRESVIKNLIEPLRDTYDRGGKAWRSSALALCIDAVGGNSNDYAYLLPAPELLHAGSLIIDDIQDKSLTRRGKECCHLIWGEEIAINAGCFSYFTVPGLYKQLPDPIRLKLMDLYFATMLGGHVGQGADIAGLSNIMPQVVETGNSELATTMIMGIHRLKSGIPVRNMAKGACIIGGGSDAQIEGLGDFFEELGVAFQIIDDVVNLEGFTTSNWKVCGEDVMEGKVTFPIALAMKSLDKATRASVWAKVESKPQNMETVKEVINATRDTGALKESREIAVKMVERAWQKCSPLIKDSFSKMILRAFGLFVLERHY